jgi:hypothetical protein
LEVSKKKKKKKKKMGGIIRALVGMGGGGGGMGASWIAAIGSMCTGQGALRGNNNGSSELSMRVAQMGSKPLALSSSRVGFLVAAGAALQLERFLSLTSSFMGDQFKVKKFVLVLLSFNPFKTKP